MKKPDGNFIIIDIGSYVIRTHVFYVNGDHLIKDVDVGQKLTPGALTITICQSLKSIESKNFNEAIFVVIPGVIDCQRRLVESLSGWPGWLNVPLAEWLEIRLTKKVFILCKETSLLINDPQKFCFLNYPN